MRSNTQRPQHSLRLYTAFCILRGAPAEPEDCELRRVERRCLCGPIRASRRMAACPWVKINPYMYQDQSVRGQTSGSATRRTTEISKLISKNRAVIRNCINASHDTACMSPHAERAHILTRLSNSSLCPTSTASCRPGGTHSRTLTRRHPPAGPQRASAAATRPPASRGGAPHARTYLRPWRA